MVLLVASEFSISSTCCAEACSVRCPGWQSSWQLEVCMYQKKCATASSFAQFTGNWSNSARKSLKSVASFGETDNRSSVLGRFGICDGSPAFKLIQVIGGSNLDSEGCGLCNKSAVFGMWMWWRSKWETHLCLCDSKVFVWVFLSPEFQAWNGWLTPEYALISSKRTFYLTLLRCFFLEHTWFTGLELGIFE